MIDYKQISNWPEVGVLLQQAMASNIAFETQLCPYNSALSAVGLVSNNAHFQPIYIVRSRTVTGVYIHQRTAGVYTAGAYNGVALCSNDGSGTLTVLAKTTDDGNIWKATAGTFIQKAFAATAALTRGPYMLVYYYQTSAQTTQPALAGLAVAGGTAAGTGTYPIFGRLTASIAPGAVGTTISLGSANNGVALWGGLY